MKPGPGSMWLAVLCAAKQLIDKGWTREAYARDSSGKAVTSTEEKACSWCLVGAVRRALDDARNNGVPMPDDTFKLAMLRLREAIQARYPEQSEASVSWFNDTILTSQQEASSFLEGVIDSHLSATSAQAGV